MIGREEIETLSRYNAEVARGIAHTPEHVARMAELQHRFDNRMEQLDRENAHLDAELEWLRRTAWPRWLAWLGVVFGVGMIIVMVAWRPA